MSSTGTVQPGVGAPQEKPAQVLRQSKTGMGQGSATWPVKIFMAVLCVLWMIPVIGLLINSFRSRDDQLSSGWWTAFFSPFSTQWTLQNYASVLGENVTGTNLAQKGRDVIFIIIVVLLVVPNQVALVPLLKLYGATGLNGTFLAVWLAHIGFGMPLAIYILRGYMSTLPNAIIESAKIDGASHFTTFWRLIMPMSVPALASFAIFQFLWVLTVALQGLQGQTGQGIELIPAAGFVTIIVPLIVFLSLQRFFIRGMTAGAVKG